ncbi:MAG: zinc ribbon domain-containing protein [Anaerolineae bacterium]|jgi:hypothetical protein
MKCAECGTPASENDLFCGECGAVLPTFDPEVAAGVGEPPAPVPPGTVDGPISARRDPRAQASFVLGIVALGVSLFWCLPIPGAFGCLSPVAALVAIILGAVVSRDIGLKGGLDADRKRAQQAIVLGVVSLVVFVVVGVLAAVFGVGLSILNDL